MKPIKKILCLIIVFVITQTSVFSSNELSWYLKRNGNSRPILDSAQEVIYNYGGYYIDKKLTDLSEDKVLYITFDAGYENGNIEKILNVLKEENVPAAFFVLDNIILKNIDLVTRMLEEGHLVCNHTKNHKNLSKLTDEEIVKNICDLEKLYSERTGHRLSKYFRFPEGRYSENALKVVNSLGYKTIFWSFAYDDWDNSRQPNNEKAIKKVLSNTHNGAVILLHPNSKTNAQILPILIKEWRKEGYRFGTLDELVK